MIPSIIAMREHRACNSKVVSHVARAISAVLHIHLDSHGEREFSNKQMGWLIATLNYKLSVALIVSLKEHSTVYVTHIVWLLYNGVSQERSQNLTGPVPPKASA